MKTKFSFSKTQIKITASILALCIIIGCVFSFAWIYNGRNINTFVHVEKPSSLAIKGFNESVVQQIDLSTVDLTNQDRKASFVFCVTGNNLSSYKLELAYTTNVPFTYTIRPTTHKVSTEGLDAGVYLTYSDSKGSYYYPTEQPELPGKYINKSDDSKTAVVDDSTSDKHQVAYGDYSKDYVEIHAEPVYYLFDNITVENVLSDGTFVDYYILELTWNEDVETEYKKETDLVYILAANGGGNE